MCFGNLNCHLQSLAKLFVGEYSEDGHHHSLIPFDTVPSWFSSLFPGRVKCSLYEIMEHATKSRQYTTLHSLNRDTNLVSNDMVEEELVDTNDYKTMFKTDDAITLGQH